MNNGQIAKEVFLGNLGVMKDVLSLAEFKLGKDTDDYKYFKRKTMDFFYNNMLTMFQKMESSKLIVKCECKARLRHGFSPCENCGGSGYRNNGGVTVPNG